MLPCAVLFCVALKFVSCLFILLPFSLDTEVLSLRDQLEDMTSRYELAQGVEEGVVAGSSDQQAIAAEIAESVRSDTAASTPSSADEEAAVAESSEVGAMSSTQETANSSTYTHVQYNVFTAAATAAAAAACVYLCWVVLFCVHVSCWKCSSCHTTSCTVHW